MTAYQEEIICREADIDIAKAKITIAQAELRQLEAGLAAFKTHAREPYLSPMDEAALRGDVPLTQEVVDKITGHPNLEMQYAHELQAFELEHN